MVCTSCKKESTNRRVCPFCFAPYPSDEPVPRGSTATRRMTGASAKVGGPGSDVATSINNAAAGANAFFKRQSPIVRWSGLGIITIALVWYFSDRPAAVTSPPGTVPANIITAEMTREEALALIKQTRETAQVETQADEVFVSYEVRTFPTQIEGQLALVQQFTRADEMVEGRKRRIFFYNPSGRVFAKSDGGLGVALFQ